MNPLRASIWAGSIITVLLTLTLYLILPDRDGTFFLGFALATGIITTLVVYWVTRRYVYMRILPIYRTIFGLTSKEETYVEPLTNPLEKTEKDMLHWADERIREIRTLQQKDDFRKEFIGNLAHELKTPLFNIQGYVSSLIEGAVDDEKVSRKFLKKASKNIERMRYIVEDLDSITAIESGVSELDIRPMDVVTCCSEVIDSFESKAAKRGVTIHHEREDPLLVRGDEFRIGQVFTNLINNAIIYGRTGGNVFVRYNDLDERVLIEVSDDGAGIAPDHLPRIFERFYRVDRSRSRDAGGSGLGLSIVKHIMEAHNQSVTAKSTLDEGSTFSFTLAKIR
jgi:two-component system phosphate regulon sensor histidine kinase PhoR